MTRPSDRELEPALRRALGTYPETAPLPEGTDAIPDSWTRRPRPMKYLGHVAAPIAVAAIAASLTWAALAVVGNPESAPFPVGASGAPAVSALASDAVELTSPPPPELPPALSVGGVPGDPVSWCYGNACVDGLFVGPADQLPAVTSLGPVEAGASFEVTGVRVFARDGSSADVPFDGVEIGPIPVGGWERLQLSATFGPGTDATYLWQIAAGS